MNFYIFIFKILIVVVCFLQQLIMALAQKSTSPPLNNQNIQNELLKQEQKITQSLLLQQPSRRQINNFGTSTYPEIISSFSYQQLPRPNMMIDGQQRNILSISPGLNWGYSGINTSGNSACSTCSTNDYSYAQKCCSFGHTICCNVNQIYQQTTPATMYTNVNNGYQNPWNSWKPSTSFSSAGGIIYDTQYNSQIGQNDKQKPGSCINVNRPLSIQTQGGYNYQSNGGYQSYGPPPNSFKSSGGYYYPGLGDNNNNYYYGRGQGQGGYDEGTQKNYCRIDNECVGNQKCCNSVCSNPSFIG